MYTPDGFMSAQIMQPGARKWHVNDLIGGTQEEKADAMSHYVAYSGPFHVEMENGKPKLCHSMTVSLFPGWLGDTQERLCNLEGDVLQLSTPPMLTNVSFSNFVTCGGEVPQRKQRKFANTTCLPQGVMAKPVLTWKKMSSTS